MGGILRSKASELIEILWISPGIFKCHVFSRLVALLATSRPEGERNLAPILEIEERCCFCYRSARISLPGGLLHDGDYGIIRRVKIT